MTPPPVHRLQTVREYPFEGYSCYLDELLDRGYSELVNPLPTPPPLPTDQEMAEMNGETTAPHLVETEETFLGADARIYQANPATQKESRKRRHDDDSAASKKPRYSGEN